MQINYITIHLWLVQIAVMGVVILLMINLIDYVFQVKQKIDIFKSISYDNRNNLIKIAKHIPCGKKYNSNKKQNKDKYQCEMKWMNI